ncbi:MAG: hypothetical protein ICV60_01450 [Pyrinomonadaceae bacterium]|nr:hypothetical protein [Pyrinomonadaceae bacterium]
MTRRKVYAAIFAVLVTGFAVAASFNYRGETAAAAPLSPSPATELLAMLPASDAIVFVDTRRALNEVMPHIFTDATMLGRVNQEIDKFREHTGTDARSIDSIAVSARFGKKSTTNPEFVAGLVRGRFTASEAIASGLAKAKAEAEAKKRAFSVTEQQYEGTTIYEVERSGGFCMAAIDSNTIAFGDLSGIKAMIDVRAGGGARVDSSLVELATLNASAVAGFAANVPASAAKEIAGSNELGEAFNSIRQIYGSADANGSMGALNVTLRSESGERAQALAEKLGSLKQLASFYFSRAASQQSSAQTGTLSAGPVNGTQVRLRDLTPFAKWIKDVTITAEGNDVRIRLEEPLADMASIICGR